MIYCELKDVRARKTWHVCPQQFFNDGTPIQELVVTINKNTIDRDVYNTNTIVEIKENSIKFASNGKYYVYSGGSDFRIVEDPKADSGYQSYIKNKGKSFEEIQKIKESIKSQLFNTLRNNNKIVPISIDNDGFYLDQDKFYLLVRNIFKRVNTMLTGPTGSGKTQVVQLICQQLGIPCNIYDMGAMHDPISDLLGVHRLEEGKSVFDYAKFTQDIQKPGVIVLDELSRCPATALNILFPVLDHRRSLPVEIAGSKDVREIPVHPDVCFISTCNIGIEYTGTSTLDKALQNRFFPIEFDYLPSNIEAKVLVKRCDICMTDANTVTSIASSIRRMNSNAETTTTVSTRETIMIADLIHDGWPILDALKCVLLPLCDSKESRDMVVKLIMSK